MLLPSFICAMTKSKKVKDSNLYRSKPKPHKQTGDLQRIVTYTTLSNEEAVIDFVESANMPAGDTTEQTIANAMVILGVGGEAKIGEFLQLHPDKEFFCSEDAPTKLANAKPKKTTTTVSPSHSVRVCCAILLLLLLFGLVYYFVKGD